MLRVSHADMDNVSNSYNNIEYKTPKLEKNMYLHLVALRGLEVIDVNHRNLQLRVLNNNHKVTILVTPCSFDTCLCGLRNLSNVM